MPYGKAAGFAPIGWVPRSGVYTGFGNKETLPGKNLRVLSKLTETMASEVLASRSAGRMANQTHQTLPIKDNESCNLRVQSLCASIRRTLAKKGSPRT